MGGLLDFFFPERVMDAMRAFIARCVTCAEVVSRAQADETKGSSGVIVPPVCAVLGVKAASKGWLAEAVARDAGLHVVRQSSKGLVAQVSSPCTDDAMAFVLQKFLRRIVVETLACGPCLLILDHVDKLASGSSQAAAGAIQGVVDLSLATAFATRHRDGVAVDGAPAPGIVGIVFCVDTAHDDVPHVVRNVCDSRIGVKRPSEEQVAALVYAASVLACVADGPAFAPSHVPVPTGACISPSLDILGAIDGRAFGHDHVAMQLVSSLRRCMRRGGTAPQLGNRVLDTDTLSMALAPAVRETEAGLCSTTVPHTKWEDIGGLEDVKKMLRDCIRLAQVPVAPGDGDSEGSGCDTRTTSSGVLLFGPPGTGKTMLIKAVATQLSLHFMSIKGPELLDMYVGSSEEMVRQVFARAREAAPTLLLFRRN